MAKRNENTRGKIMAVIVLSIVAVVMAYFRFFHKPESSASTEESVSVEALFPIPELPASFNRVAAQRHEAPVAYKPPARDIFAPPAPPAPLPGSAAYSNRLARGGAASAPVPEPLQLTGLMQSAQGPQAIINGKIVRTGDRVGAYMVAETGQREVVLTNATERIVLTLRP